MENSKPIIEPMADRGNEILNNLFLDIISPGSDKNNEESQSNIPNAVGERENNNENFQNQNNGIRF